MATLVLKDLPEAETAALRARAARNGRSVEAELRALVRAAIEGEADPRADEGGVATEIRQMLEPFGGFDIPEAPLTDADLDTAGLAGAINRRFAPYGGVELPPVHRIADREPPSFD